MITGTFVTDLKNISVEFVDKPFDGVCFRVFYEEHLVSFEVFMILDGCLVALLSKHCIWREEEVCLKPGGQLGMRIEKQEVRTIIPAAEIAPGVMLVSSSCEARGRGPEHRTWLDFPTEVGPRKTARRIFSVVTKHGRRDEYMYLHPR